MSAGEVNRVKKLTVGSHIEKAILLYLADCCTTEGCWPSQERICRDLELSSAAVKRGIKKLEEKHFIARTFQKSGGRVLKTEYQFTYGIHQTPSMVSKGTHPEANGISLNGSGMNSNGIHQTPRIKGRTTKETKVKRANGSKEPKAAGRDKKTPEAIKLVRSICERYPPKAIWPDIQQALGELPDEVRLSDCFKRWITTGKNPTNYDWILDWYVNGIPTFPAKNRTPYQPASDILPIVTSSENLGVMYDRARDLPTIRFAEEIG
jgi:SOS-response transcriptional repressor LexA